MKMGESTKGHRIHNGSIAALYNPYLLRETQKAPICQSQANSFHQLSKS